MRTLAALVFVTLAVLVAGCGTTTVTKKVAAKPCATKKQMSDCLLVYLVRYQKDQQTGAKVDVRCSKAADKFTCVTKFDSKLLGAECDEITVIRLAHGVLYPTGSQVVPNKKCDVAFGKA